MEGDICGKGAVTEPPKFLKAPEVSSGEEELKGP